MNKKPLDRLAEAYGLLLAYRSEAGMRRAPSDDDKRAVLRVMGVSADDAEAIAESLAAAPGPLDKEIVAPQSVRCHVPEWLADGRAWGVTCQLYGLRSARNHGIGDFEDLARLAEGLAADGADFIGINPVHALFTAEPERCSPFSPSNRRFLNPLYIALDRVPGSSTALRIDESLRSRLCASPHIDYRAVAAFKLGALRMLWARTSDDNPLWAPEDRSAFDAFVEAGGDSLLAHARFEALSHRMVADGNGAGWHGWPEDYRKSTAASVRRFAAENDREVRFHLWLQWMAHAQLGEAADRARAAGMRIGLYLDFAVGTAPDGSATWTDPALVVPGANIGAPPDAFFAEGQDWGLAPLSPTVMRARRLATYRSELETAMQHAGAIRIDHAMSLHRLYWIPHGGSPVNGCYVLYPFADMVRVLAEVSAKTRTIVIGEDLGTVPKGFSATMESAGMLSCRVLYFERSRGGFRAAASFQRNALLSASTHDLPPIAAWWRGSDIALFQRLGLLDSGGAEQQRIERERDRRALVARLRRDLPRRAFAALLPSEDDAEEGELSCGLAVAIHGFLARTPCRLLGLQFEDLCGAEAPVNVPGTNDEYPNWRLRAPAAIEPAARAGRWASVVEAVARERPRTS